MDARALVEAHAATLNGIVARSMPDPGETGIARLERGFSTAFAASLDALIRRAGKHEPGVTPLAIDGLAMAIARLLVAAIARRYYAFPDRHVMAVRMDVLFDNVLPKAIDAGCLDGGTGFLEYLFNAGEHLGAASDDFYRAIDAIATSMTLASIPVDVLVHACAWVAGDERYRARALDLVATGAFPPGAFLAVAGLAVDPARARATVDAIAPLLAGDRWVSVTALRGLPAVTSAVNDPASLARNVGACLAATGLDAAPWIDTVLEAGAFEGLGGSFDTPPVVAGMHDGQLLVVTATGQVFHGSVTGGPGLRLRRAGTIPSMNVLFLPPGRIIGVDASRKVTDLGTMTAITRLPGSGPAGPLAAAAGRIATVDAGAGAIVTGHLDTGTVTSVPVDGAGAVTALAMLDDGTVAVATGGTRSEVAVHGPAGSRELLSVPGRVALAASGRLLACLDESNTLHVIDPLAGTNRTLRVPPGPGTVTSFHATAREVVMTRSRTFTIHVAGWPPGVMP